MIVRNAGSSLHLITQPDHAALARRVMERWAPLHDAPRRASILLAVEEHDNGWREPDSAPLADPATGGVFDFIQIPVATRQAVWPRGVQRLAEDDEWSAALVAHHAATVYDRYRGDPAWAGFFPELEAFRDKLAESSGRNYAQLTRDYVFVRIGDLISLIFCAQWDEPQTYDQWTFHRDGERVVVSPDAFGGREVPIAIRAREIPSRRYNSDEDLRDTIRRSPIVTLSGTVTPG
jgi:hypothetical protein